MTARRLAVTGALAGALLAGVPAGGAGERERVDLHDARGRRTGYAIVDRESGRVDFYDVSSRRTGWGRLDPATGRVERFGLDGRRQDPTAVPVPPRR